MFRQLRPILIPAAVLLALWHFGLLARLSDAIHSSTRDLTGATTVDVGQDVKRSIVQSNLQRALREYRATVGEEPTSLAALVDAGLLQRAEMRDEWNQPLVVEQSGAHLVVRSVGRDGQRGTDDDWLLGR